MMTKNLVRIFFFSLFFISCFSQKCGDVKVKHPKSLIVRGEISYPGQWPWLVSLHELITPPVFFCGSTLVSKNKLITAAHCVIEISSSKIIAMLGRFNVSDSNEGNWTQRRILEIIIHEDFKNDDENYARSDADIAILSMDRPVEFTNFIQPICLPKSDKNVFNVEGVVAGYGQIGPDSSPSKIPLFVYLLSIDLLDCLTSRTDASRLVSKRTFCAGGETGIPCHGDSGSGFVKFINNKWKLLGIVSHAFSDQCRTQDKITFVNIRIFVDWIKEKLGHNLCGSVECPLFSRCFVENGQTECRCNFQLTLENSECKFSCDNGTKKYKISDRCNGHLDCIDKSDESSCVQGKIYENWRPPGCDSCSACPGCTRYKTLRLSDKTNISSDNFLISLSLDESVERIFINKSKHINFLPLTVQDRFSNLIEFFFVRNSVKNVKKDNFAGLKKLKSVFLYANKIKKIEENSFEDLKNLEVLWLHKNQIKFLPPKIFENLIPLKELYLYENKLKAMSEHLFKNLKHLEELWLHENQIEFLPPKIFENLISMKKLSLYKNKLETLSENLFKNLENLEVLWLHENQIEFLPPKIFENLISLKKLSLYKNKLETLSEDLFKNLKNLRNLEELWLHENEIKCLPLKVFENLISLKKLSRYKNKLVLKLA